MDLQGFERSGVAGLVTGALVMAEAAPEVVVRLGVCLGTCVTLGTTVGTVADVYLKPPSEKTSWRDVGTIAGADLGLLMFVVLSLA